MAITTPTDLDAALEPARNFQCHITKPNQGSLLHHIRVDTPPIIRTCYNQHEKELRNIRKYAQSQRLVNAYHPLNIDLLAQAAAEHY